MINNLLIICKCLALWVKFSADDILNYFSYFLKKTGFDISCKLSCMKSQILLSRKNKKTISLPFAELVSRVVMVNDVTLLLFMMSLDICHNSR